MNPLVLSLLLFFGPPAGHASPGSGAENVVRVCSVATGSCEEHAARLLEPTLPRSGQIAVIDPETKTVVQPTRAQLDELAVAVEEGMAKRQGERVEKMANGTLRLKSSSGFVVQQKAVLRKAEPKREEKP
ncbi:MAG TPA: hypothetical protein VFR03_07235 [Thermoanaerobaculia bacterium]|nr:hypothetical protein [Thermoanaerobaculia bacterium]